jgi:prophage regulatory protein
MNEPMTTRILRYSDLETQLGMNRVTIWRRTKTDPTFPRPIRLGNSRNAALGFLAEEVEAWIVQQAATARVSR